MLDSALEVSNPGCNSAIRIVSILIMLDSALEEMMPVYKN